MDRLDMSNKINIVDSEVGSVNVNYRAENKSGFDFLHVGIIGIFIDIVCYIIGSGKNKREERYFKQKTYNPQKGTYLDSKCRERLYSDDSFVFTRRNRFGETEIEYQNGVVRNLAQEKYNKAPGSVTQLAGYDPYNKNHYFTTAIGYRYKDRKTGQVYVVRNMKYNHDSFLFYLDVQTGKLVRPTDSQLRMENEAKRQNKEYYNEEYFKRVIDYFNNNIKNLSVDLFYRNKDNSVEYSEQTIQHVVSIRRTR